MRASAYDELVGALRGLVHRETRVVSPPAQRWKVVKANPLVIEELHGDVVLEEGDPDVEVASALLTTRPAAGDMVLVHHDGADWIVAAVIE